MTPINAFVLGFVLGALMFSLPTVWRMYGRYIETPEEMHKRSSRMMRKAAAVARLASKMEGRS